MAKIVLDRSGDLQKRRFYRFHVPFEDRPAGETPTPEWVVAPRTPTNDELRSRGKDTWLYIEDLPDSASCAQTKDCRADSNHVTFSYYTKIQGESFGGPISPIIAPANGLVVILSDALKRRVEALKVSGARVDAMKVSDHNSGASVIGFWTIQFVGRARLRVPKFVDARNQCPNCGQAPIVCESCGYWNFRCPQCEQHMVVLESAHKGKTDNRLPYEDGASYGVIEGKAWDGSDLVGGRGWNFASKRFIDWLLRIHAAPFYAEPVWFCVDGMSDQQKKWFDELQKPFEA